MQEQGSECVKVDNLFGCPDKQILAKSLAAAQVDKVVRKERILMWKITLFLVILPSSCHFLVVVASFSVCFHPIISLFHFMYSISCAVPLFLLSLYLFCDSHLFLLLPVDSCCFSKPSSSMIILDRALHLNIWISVHACLHIHMSVWLLSWSQAKALVRLFKSCPVITVQTKWRDLSKSLAVPPFVCVHSQKWDKDGNHAHYTLPSF